VKARKAKPQTDKTRPLRIIGGQWRGRKLNFPDLEGLRPTGDRIRETLFNWLAPSLPGSRCLDLFAGSGALGLEALSRGAGETLMLEKNPTAAAQLSANLDRLGSESGRVITTDSLHWLTRELPRPFDQVFIDPPFDADLWQACIDQLANRPWLAEGAGIYLETDPGRTFNTPDSWRLHRDKTSGQVRYRLFIASPTQSPNSAAKVQGRGE